MAFQSITFDWHSRMTLSLYASTALVVLTLTTPALAQSNAMVTESGASLPAPVSNGQEPATSAQSPATESSPRFIKGNDIVVAPAKPVVPLGGSPLSFNFEEAPVAEVVRTLLGDILKVPYVLHPPLTGTVTLATRTPIPPDQAVYLLESALQANGLAMVRDTRGTYQVGRPDLVRGMGGAVRQATRSGALPPGYGAIVIPLQYIGAGEMAAILKPMVPAEAIVRVDPLRNLLVMTGTRTQAEGWLDMVSTFDVDLLKGMSVGVFPLKHVTIQEVETALRLMTGGGAVTGSAGGAPGGAVAAGTAGAQGGAGRGGVAAGAGQSAEVSAVFGGLRILPIERLNSVLVVTPRASALEEARRWIEKLDQPGNNGAEPQLHIYKVQNGNARHLAGVLSGIFGGGQAQGSNANSGVAPGLGGGYGNSNSQFGNSGYGNSGFGNSGFGSSGFGSSSGFGGSGFSNSGFGNSGFGNSSMGGAQNSQFGQNGMAGGSQAPSTALIGNIRVMADELNNSILVWGTASEFAKIEPTLKRLDLPPTQVLIDASIIEVTLNDSLEYGLQWAFSGGSGDYRGTGVMAGLPGGLGKPNSDVLLNTVNPGRGFSYSLINSAGNVRLILNALAQKGLVKMVSNPSLMVLDNHVAMMSVGNQVPVPTQLLRETTGTTTQGYQYRDTGVNLAVTPSVNAGNLVTMMIQQSLTDTVSGTAEQPTFLQRQINSKVAVRSGETVVLGGLIKDRQTADKSGIPLLQDIPIVGNLFGINKRDGDRTELLVILTPRVVRTDPEIREVSEELRDRLKGLRVIDERLPQSRQNGAPPAAATLPLPISPVPAP